MDVGISYALFSDGFGNICIIYIRYLLLKQSDHKVNTLSRL